MTSFDITNVKISVHVNSYSFRKVYILLEQFHNNLVLMRLWYSSRR